MGNDKLTLGESDLWLAALECLMHTVLHWHHTSPRLDFVHCEAFYTGNFWSTVRSTQIFILVLGQHGTDGWDCHCAT